MTKHVSRALLKARGWCLSTTAKKTLLWDASALAWGVSCPALAGLVSPKSLLLATETLFRKISTGFGQMAARQAKTSSTNGIYMALATASQTMARPIPPTEAATNGML